MAVPRLKNRNRVRSYRRNPNRVQVDTKKNAQETLMLQRYFTKSPSLNRTALTAHGFSQPKNKAEERAITQAKATTGRMLKELFGV